MTEPIEFWGIETNNLKNIDVKIYKNSLNLIIGPSGSGKSSLAYDTIAQIGQHEYLSMFADNIEDPAYKLKGYKNMLAAIPIKQTNFNTNIRSTIGTYFGINRFVSLLYSSYFDVDEDFFVLNKEENICEHCHGLGYVKVLDEHKIVNYDIPLSKNPFKCWNRYKDFYAQIIKQFCIDKNIDYDKSFRQLSKIEKDTILYGESNDKYSIRYKKNSSFSRRTTKYYGVLTECPMFPNLSISSAFYTDRQCPNCDGRKYSKEYNKYSINNLTIGDFMTMPFSDLKKRLDFMMLEIQDTRIKFLINNIYRFIIKAIDLNLDYLFFHRSIPTLSGGELQRLRMVQVMNTQLSNLLIVLDEPLAGLSGKEKKKMFDNIIHLSKSHTILVVDHSDLFVSASKNIIVLGKGSGVNGGYIINSRDYLLKESVIHNLKIKKSFSCQRVIINSQIYDYAGANINLGLGCMNLITGRSGVGKSTLIREYLPQFFEKYLYINQKPLFGNKHSTVSTVIGISNSIFEKYAKIYKKDKKFFSNQPGCDGVCTTCNGTGYLEYGNEYDGSIRLMCKECSGYGFNKNLRNYKLHDKNIFDIWNMTVDEGVEFFKPIDEKISNILEVVSSVLLGHLKIGQATSTLSGGENVRLKIIKSYNSSAKIISVDEPFKGLSNSEIYSVTQFLRSFLDKGKTIIIVDHSDNISHYFEHCIELDIKNNILVDKNAEMQ